MKRRDRSHAFPSFSILKHYCFTTPRHCAGGFLVRFLSHRNLLCGVASEGHRAAAGEACHEVRVGRREHAARAVAGRIEAVDRGAVLADDLHVGVDAAAVQGGQVPCAGADPVERSGVDRRQAVLLLAVVLVDALGAELVVAVDGGDKVVGRDVQLLGQLLERVGLLDIAVGDQLLDLAPDEGVGHVGEGTVREREQAAAADLVELLAVLLVVGVEDIHIGVVRLHDHGVKHELVRAGFVAEALAVQVDL